MTDHIFPQDGATGVEETVDWDDAGAFAQLVYSLNTIDYVVKGYEFTVDDTNDILNIGPGVARVTQDTTKTNDHSGDDGPEAKTLELAAFVAQTSASGDISLTGGAVNHVYLSVDQTTNDRPLFRVNTDGTEPSDPTLKLGTVDTSGSPYTYSYVNRLPTGQFRSLEIRAPPTDQQV